LANKVDLIVADNIRPKLETENLGPARDKIHDIFMEHVMQQAPGYNKLLEWTKGPDLKLCPSCLPCGGGKHHASYRQG
jgi:hypothetical protein